MENKDSVWHGDKVIWHKEIPMTDLHSSHVLRFSFAASASNYTCVNCLGTDVALGNWGVLAEPCPKPVGKGGITKEEWIASQVRLATKSAKGQS